MSHGYQEQEVIWCDVCDEFYAESRIDVMKHLQKDHTLTERRNANMTSGVPPEDTRS
jgi:fructosamine-3-kinase